MIKTLAYLATGFTLILLTVLLLDRANWIEQCERFGGIAIQRWFDPLTCVPNLDLTL